LKYLVTDDSKLARLSLIKSLKACENDAEIFQASNGIEAIEIVNNENVDVIFLDLTMPLMDGYTALPKLLKINSELKIVVISADVQVKAREKVLSLGALLHVKKPTTVEKMKEILENI